MGADTLSVMLHQLSDLAMFDFAAYLSCKPYLAAKDKKIIEACCKVLTRINRQKGEPLRLLDVGSGEASLIEGVCTKIVEITPPEDSRHLNLMLDCVEPHPAGQVYLRKFARWTFGRGIQVHCHDYTIEEFLSVPRRLYDAIICCHSLYHIRMAEWSGVLRLLLNSLSSSGFLIINLVSRSSDIYNILDQLPGAEIEKLPRTFESHGWLYFAEDLDRVISTLDIDFTCNEISAQIEFPASIVRELSRYLAIGRGEESVLLKFLAFMFRLQPEDLAFTGKSILEHLTQGGDSIGFRSVDHLYTIRKINP